MSRTPSKEAHLKVLNAAFKLIGERGVESTSMDAIAAEAGVSKATVYKHWENKDALLIEVIQHMMEKLPEFDSGDPRQDMAGFLGYIAKSRKREELGRIWPRVVGYAAANPAFARALREHAFNPRRVRIQQILERAVEMRALRPDLDPEFAMDLLMGPILHRRFASEDPAPFDMAERIVDYFWEVFRPR